MQVVRSLFVLTRFIRSFADTTSQRAAKRSSGGFRALFRIWQYLLRPNKSRPPQRVSATPFRPTTKVDGLPWRIRAAAGRFGAAESSELSCSSRLANCWTGFRGSEKNCPHRSAVCKLFVCIDLPIPHPAEPERRKASHTALNAPNWRRVRRAEEGNLPVGRNGIPSRSDCQSDLHGKPLPAARLTIPGARCARPRPPPR